MSKPAAASHGRVEYARQALVKAEEAYLRAHGWHHVLFGGGWYWAKAAEGTSLTITMDRTPAVQFQHTMQGE